MPPRQTLPHLWLMSDARNDHLLEAALARLPRGSGLVYRHHHLSPARRYARYRFLRRVCRRRGHWVILAGSPAQANAWGADGSYGAPAALARPRAAGLRLATAHDLREIAAANRVRPDALMLAPVFPTRTHPGAPNLGPLRFRLLARRAAVPVIALGGMDHAAARHLRWARWAAIDGLSQPRSPGRRRGDS